jgi:hypothetical protein
MRVKNKGSRRRPLGSSPSAYWVRGLRLSVGPDSEKVFAIFQPDTLTRDQFYSTYVRTFHLEPEKILMLAVLRDAVSCFQENLGATEGKKRQLFLDANEWIMDEDSSYFYSFENICDLLGFAPSYMRRGLVSWKARTIRQREQQRVSPINAGRRMISKGGDSVWA